MKLSNPLRLIASATESGLLIADLPPAMSRPDEVAASLGSRAAVAPNEALKYRTETSCLESLRDRLTELREIAFDLT